MKRIGVYAGSFDIPTRGHVAVMIAAKRLFDEVVIAIGHNPGKNRWFTFEQSSEMIKEIIEEIGPSGFRIEIFNNFLVNFIESKRQHPDQWFIVRGLRNVSDFHLEMEMAMLNKSLFAGLYDTIFIPTPKEYSLISSSLVKSLVGPACWEEVVQELVPPNVHKALLDRIKT